MSTSEFGEEMLLVRLTDRSEAHAAERMRVDFVANASHELRTPLATLVGYSETLLESPDDIDPPTRARFMTIVHDEALRMQRLVEDLISLSRIEAERFSGRPMPCGCGAGGGGEARHRRRRSRARLGNPD